MPVQPFGKADPYYDALRVMSNQNIQGAALGDTGAGGVLENKIYLWPADGSTVSTYDATEAGLLAALTAAASGDTVWLPSIVIALTAALTIPANVTIVGISGQAQLSFGTLASPAITLSASSVLDRVFVTQAANDANDLILMQAPTSGTGYIVHCALSCVQSGSGDAVALNGGAGDVTVNDSVLSGQSTSGAGYGARGSSGIVTLDDTLILGSTAPLDATAGSYSIGSAVSTGTINGNNASGVELSGLTIGNWYAIESTAGPFNLHAGDAGWDSYRFAVNTSSTFPTDYASVSGWADSLVYPSPSTLILHYPAWASFAEAVDAQHGRIYFRATTTSIWFWCSDGAGQFADNTGTLGYKLSNATVPASNIITHAARLDPVTGEPAQGDRSVWDALDYQTRHTNDINAVTGIHWSKAELDANYGSGSHDSTYLRLDTSNDPLTSDLEITPTDTASTLESPLHISADDPQRLDGSPVEQVTIENPSTANVATKQANIAFKVYDGSAHKVIGWVGVTAGSFTFAPRANATYIENFSTGGLLLLSDDPTYGVIEFYTGGYTSTTYRRLIINPDGTIRQYGQTFLNKPDSTAAGIGLDPNAATGNFQIYLSPPNLTGNHRATLQDRDGTIAYLDDIPAASIGAVSVYNETQIADGISTIYYLANYAVPGSIRVYIDGIRQPASDDVAPTDVVTFTVAPTAGAVLLFDYEMDLLP